MTRPVDVLAVMDTIIDLEANWGDHVSANAAREARATVAELIDRADNVATVLSNLIAAGQVDARYGQHVTDLTAAIDRAGGAL